MELFPKNILCCSIFWGLLWKFGLLEDIWKFAVIEWVASIFLLQSEKWTHEHFLLFFESVTPGGAYYVTITSIVSLLIVMISMFKKPDKQHQLVKKEMNLKKETVSTIKRGNEGAIYVVQLVTFIAPDHVRVLPFLLEIPTLSYAERRQHDIERFLVGCKSLHSRYLKRDGLGWLIPKTTLNSNLEIAEISHVTIDWRNKQCPTIEIYYKPAENSNGLLSVDDIKCMLQLDDQEIQRISFSLDPAIAVMTDDDKHPLCLQQLITIHKKVFGPNKLASSGVMDTLFQADYIMKSLTTGGEVSANYPFNVRPVSHLLGHLSTELQHALRPPHLRESKLGLVCVCPHRFWIDVERLQYQAICSNEKEVYFISSPDVSVKTESMGRCQTRIECTDFATDMTTNYPELAQHFPIFARLTELSKLQFALRKTRERLSDKGYKLSPANAELPKETNMDFHQLHLVPTAHSETFSVIGGVNMAPTYNSFPFTPSVDDSVTYEHTQAHALSPLKYLDRAAREGGIRLHTRGEHTLSPTESTQQPFFQVKTGLHSFNLAMLASIVMKK